MISQYLLSWSDVAVQDNYMHCWECEGVLREWVPNIMWCAQPSVLPLCTAFLKATVSEQVRGQSFSSS